MMRLVGLNPAVMRLRNGVFRSGFRSELEWNEATFQHRQDAHQGRYDKNCAACKEMRKRRQQDRAKKNRQEFTMDTTSLQLMTKPTTQPDIEEVVICCLRRHTEEQRQLRMAQWRIRLLRVLVLVVVLTVVRFYFGLHEVAKGVEWVMAASTEFLFFGNAG